MKKAIIITSKIILLIACLNIFAWSVYHVHIGGQRLGVFTNLLKEFSEFPSLVVRVARELSNPERLSDIEANFIPLNDLDYDVFAINASFGKSKWTIRLANLRNDSSIYEWYLAEKDYLNTGRVFSHAVPRQPIILGDTSLIIHNDVSFNLFRLDANSEVLWHNSEHQFHHSINLDSSNNIWACTKNLLTLAPQNIEYWDDYLTQIDINNGQVIYHKSLTEILNENNLGYLIHGYGNIDTRFGDDPLHLNDIEPVLNDGSYWKQGDLFISLRHRSIIFLYRPSTNRIIRIIQGPFFNQHDIDILSDSTISLFNNNASSLGKIKESSSGNLASHSLPNSTLNHSSEVLIYNMKDSSFTSLYPNQFAENKIFTETQGLHHLLDNGDLFVEEQNKGKVYIFNEQKILLNKYFNKPVNGHVENPQWVRIYENLNFLNL